MRCSTLLATALCVCAPLVLTAQSEQKTQPQAPRRTDPPRTDMQKAVDEFRAVTRELGLRPEGPRRRSASRGAPKWHGRIFENFRNDFLDAVPHEVVQRGGSKSTLRRNQYGFNVSGPVILPWVYNGGRNTYFSFSYEGVRETVSRSYLRTIAPLPERTGDWSESVDLAGNPLPIYDPQTTRPNPAYDASQPVSETNLQYLRDVFPGNRIPSQRLDPVVHRALEYLPAPNANVGPFFRNNFFIHAPEVNTANGVIAKLDHNVHERHRLSFGLNYSNGLVGSADWYPNGANPGQPDRDYRNRRASAEYIFTISPRTVNTFSVEAASDASESGADDDTDYPAAIGFHGPLSKRFPWFTFDRYEDMGRIYPASKNVSNSFVFSNGISIRRGKHSARITGQAMRYQINTYQPQFPSGMFRFSAGLTSLPGIVNTGNGFATFTLGLSDYAKVTQVTSPSYFRRGMLRLVLSDSWEIRPGLSAWAQASIERQGPRTEKFDRMSNVDLGAVNPATGRKGILVAANRGGYGHAFQPLRNRVEPSIGLAWNPRGNTKSVVRASYSRSYYHIPVYFGQWGTQAFNPFPTLISPNVQLQPAMVVANGFPPSSRPVPDLAPDAADDTFADLMDMSARQPTYQSFSFSAERELPGALVLTIGTYQSGGKNLLVGNWAANPNAIPLEALQYRDRLNDEAFNRSLRPYPQYKGFEMNGAWPRGRYQRNAATARLEKRASQGLTLSASYEFGRQWDDYSGPYGTQDFFNGKNEWSLTAGHNPHRLSLSYNYELPLGSKKPFLTYNDWRRHMIDGWSISGMTSFASGDPIALYPMFNNTGGVVGSLRVNVVPGVDAHVDNPGPDGWFNPAAFAQPEDFTTGNASRTHPTLRNPIAQNHDLSLTKRFGLAADRAVEFSAVGLNFLNHANWTDPDPLIGPESAPNVNAGKIIGSRGGRVIQLGLRLTF